MRRSITLRHFNDVFTLLVALIAIYILTSPLLGNLSLWWAKKADHTHGYVYQSKSLPADVPKQNLKPLPKDNRLVVPKLELDQQINEGPSVATLNKGPWRRPNSSTPDKGGNTVIASHRYYYGSASAFFHLDKLVVGDRITIYWQEKEYDYEVSSVTVVSPLDLEVESSSADPILTLYTCTPLWTSNQRLVIKAKEIQT